MCPSASREGRIGEELHQRVGQGRNVGRGDDKSGLAGHDHRADAGQIAHDGGNAARGRLERQFEVVRDMTKDDLAQLRHLCLLLVESARKELGK